MSKITFKNYWIFLLLTFSTCISQVQTPTWNWAKRAGSTRDDRSFDVIADKDNNVYNWGTFTNGITLGSNSLTGNANYVVKYNSIGTVLWAKKIPASIKHITLDTNGNLYVTGNFYDTLTLDGLSITTTSQMAFVAKYSPSGAILWLQKKGQIFTTILKMEPLNETKLVIYGVSVDEIPNNNVMTYSTWIAKMDVNSGEISSIKPLATFNPGELVIQAIKVDKEQNIYISGLDDPNTTLYPNWQLARPGTSFIAKFDVNFNFLWSKVSTGTIGSAGSINIDGLAIDPQNNVYQLGFFKSDRLTLDATHDYTYPIVFGEHKGTGDFIIKYAPDGTIIWDKIMLRPFSNSIIRTRALSNDKFGNIYYAGSYGGTMNIDNLAVEFEGPSNVFISKINTDGNLIWLQKNAATIHSFVTSICEDGKGGIYAGGYFVNGINTTNYTTFGTTSLALAAPIVPYAGDVFMAKLGNCTPTTPTISPAAPLVLCSGETLNLEASSGQQYLWSTGATTASISIDEPGTYSVIVANDQGCYATSIPVEITVATVNTGVTRIARTLKANADNATYQWGQCTGTNFLPISGQTTQVFTPSASGNYAVEVFQNGCRKISDCYTVDLLNVDSFHQPLFQLFPNPNKGQYNIHVGNSFTVGKLTVFDLYGRSIATYNITTPTLQINQSNLQSGIYLVQIEIDGKQDVKKMIVSE